jgi:hypothetical protein
MANHIKESTSRNELHLVYFISLNRMRRYPDRLSESHSLLLYMECVEWLGTIVVLRILFIRQNKKSVKSTFSLNLCNDIRVVNSVSYTAA